MKKRVAPLISAVVLSSALLGGCVKISISTDRKNPPIGSTGSPVDRATESFENTSTTDSRFMSDRDLKIQDFWEMVDQNPYDKWLNQTLAEGIMPEKQIFFTYVGFWKAELQAAIQSGESLFDDANLYNQWKTGLEQWLDSAQAALRAEMEVLHFTIPQLESIIPHCRLVRQKVLDTKFFLFYYERDKTDSWDCPVVVTWVTDNDGK